MADQDTFNPPRMTKKDYAERPFQLREFFNKSFTITENLTPDESPRTEPRESQKTGTKYAVALIRVTDGLFDKDLALFKSEYEKICIALPDSIVNLKGVTMTYNNGKLEYLTATRPEDTEEDRRNFTKNTNVGPRDQKELYIRQLCEALTQNAKLGADNDTQAVLQAAERITPGDAMGLIVAAKQAGVIYENKGVYYVT